MNEGAGGADAAKPLFYANLSAKQWHPDGFWMDTVRNSMILFAGKIG